MKRTAVTVTNKKRIAIGFIIIAVLMVLLAFRVAWIQVVDADELTEKAIDHSCQKRSDIRQERKRTGHQRNLLFGVGETGRAGGEQNGRRDNRCRFGSGSSIEYGSRRSKN